MGGSTGHLGNMLLAFALAGLIGAVAAVMFIILGDYDWSAAVFVGGLIAVVLGALLGVVLGKPLPSLAEIQAKSAALKPAVMMETPAAAPAMAPAAFMTSPPTSAPISAPASAPAVTPAATKAATPVDDAAVTSAGEGTKPAGLSGPRGGKADDLKNIEGIGPVLEKLCHDMGVYHFDQIAGWGPGEVAWMNANLKGFKGRVGRDKWVAQARLIGSAGMEEFKRRAATNDY